MSRKVLKRLKKIFSVSKPKDDEPKQKIPLRRKMVMVGDGDCGKTCLLTRMCTGSFVDVGYVPTVFESQDVNVWTGKEDVDLTIFDTAGQEGHDQLRPLSYLDADVALICFNLADADTLTNVTEKWAPEVLCFCENVPIILVGNKKDLRDLPLDLEHEESNVLTTDDTALKSSTAKDNNDNNIAKENCSSGNVEKEYNRKHSVTSLSASKRSIPFHVQAPIKHNEGAAIARRIGAIAYFETSALYGDNVEELLFATTKASMLRTKKSKTFKPFLGTLKSWKSVYRLELLTK